MSTFKVVVCYPDSDLSLSTETPSGEGESFMRKPKLQIYGTGGVSCVPKAVKSKHKQEKRVVLGSRAVLPQEIIHTFRQF